MDLTASRDKRLARRRHYCFDDDDTVVLAPRPPAALPDASLLVQRIEDDITDALQRWRTEAAALGDDAASRARFRQSERALNLTLERLLEALRAACGDNDDAWERRVARLYMRGPRAER